MTRSLVTGATGFLGQHLVRHLISLGEEVHVLQRPSSASAVLELFKNSGVRVHRYETLDAVREIAASVHPERVFHLATHYLKDHRPDEVATLIEANISFGAQLLEGLVGTDARVVSAMSFFQFRDKEPAPFSLYSASKQAFLDISDYYRHGRDLDIRQVVLYDTYGHGDTRDKLIPRLLGALGTPEPVGLGSPLQPLNMLYSDDVASGLVAASEPKARGMMALRAPATVTVSDIVDTIRDVAGQTLSVQFNEAGAVNDLVTVAGDWPTPPGWTPAFDFAAGIRATLAR